MPRDKREVDAALAAKGFQDRGGDHHYFVYYTLQDKKTAIKTKTSHTKEMKSLTDELPGEMARQCRLTKTQFPALVDCPMPGEEYESILARSGSV